MNYVSKNKNFGFDMGSESENKDFMIMSLMPVIQEIGQEHFLDSDSFFITLDETFNSKYPDFTEEEDDFTAPDFICGIIAHYKYNLSIDEICEKLFSGVMVEWVFEKYIDNDPNKILTTFNNTTSDKVDLSDQGICVENSDSIPEDRMIEMMVPLLEEFQSLSKTKNERFNYLSTKLGSKLKSLMYMSDFPFIATFTTMLNWKYKIDFDQCVKLALEGKIIRACFKEFLKEQGAQLASNEIAKHTSDNVN